jgi:hypothetical protein
MARAEVRKGGKHSEFLVLGSLCLVPPSLVELRRTGLTADFQAFFILGFPFSGVLGSIRLLNPDHPYACEAIPGSRKG